MSQMTQSQLPFRSDIDPLGVASVSTQEQQVSFTCFHITIMMNYYHYRLQVLVVLIASEFEMRICLPVCSMKSKLIVQLLKRSVRIQIKYSYFAVQRVGI